MLSAALLERWPQVCRVKITCTKLPTNRFVSTTKISMKCVVNWIPLRIRVRSRNTQPHLNMKDDNDGACSYNFFSLVQICGHVPRRENLNKTKPIKIDVILLKNATNRRYNLCRNRRFPKRSCWNSEKRKEQDLVLSVRKIFL